MKIHYLVAIVSIAVLAGCSQPVQPENPVWVETLIAEFQSQPVGNPPKSIWRYEYNGQVVYYLPAQCCDLFGTLYDAVGDELCSPSGGITGKGDGRCPDFVSKRTNEQLIWEDPRTR